ncbi:hypothetical protein HMPREF0290_1819 [Corynebacterium efficiens YS-314]|uniref:Secreted protein n=1 Tax=Corynebacterium efficiens (strain DSM 44549 / YS-314 / AJ 12310 / JCM 11189 / NBRC 100395) TaxID=196164 RepID=Q8FPJ1_COREF|nr:copper chaperone PCu(A)C [Corynebacterium efficiens]EEW49578.1 hypothetical protein HMPREF0290_1819 [Corynebacterium efficiens YS-314]BAC18597.1 conserved hypothetical protein [Corynebacterium efficiens YS-314]
MKLTIKNSVVGSIVVVGALALAACSPANENDSTETATEATTTTATSTTSTTTATDAAADAPLTLTDGFVRATVEGTPMTAIFGTLTNTTDEEISLTGFEASVDAAAYEIHEVVDGVMREKEGGLTIAAGDTHELAPGQDHLMLMGLEAPVEAGDTVDITLILGDGTEIELDPVPVRTIAAGDESYGEDGELMGNTGMDSMDHSAQ